MPVVHNRVIISGSIGAGERWQTGVAFTGSVAAPEDVVNSQDELNAWATGIASYITTANLNDIRQTMSGVTKIESVVTQYKAGNDLVLTSAPKAPAPYTGSGTQFNVPQTAWVASLLTNSPGARHRGRMYWPGTGIPFSSTMRIPSTNLLAAEVVEFIQAMADEATPTVLRPCIYSPTYDEVTPVTRVRVGDVADTQRRRRDNLVEVYSEALF